MHVRVLQARAHGRQAMPEPFPGAHVLTHEGERRVHTGPHLGLASQFVAPGQRVKHEGDVVEIGRRVEHGALARQSPRPALAEPCLVDQIFVAERRKRLSLVPAQQRSVREHVSLPASDARALEGDIAGGPVGRQFLKEPAMETVEPGLAPERQSRLEHPGAYLGKGNLVHFGRFRTAPIMQWFVAMSAAKVEP